MTVSDFARLAECAVKAGGDEALARPLDGCYVGDLLSRVISRAKPGGVWITIMTNVNVCAVALLADVGAVVLCEGVEPDAELVKKCVEENVPLLLTQLDAYALITRYNSETRA